MRRRDRRIGIEQQLRHRLAEQVGAADDDGIQPRQVLAMHLSHQKHGAGRRAGDQPGFEIAGGQLAGIDDMQAIDILLRPDRLNDRIRIQMLRQRQLHENAVDGRIVVQRGHQGSQLFLRRLRRQRVLDGLEAALLGHLALGVHIGVAGRIVADDDDRKPGLHAGLRLKSR